MYTLSLFDQLQITYNSQCQANAIEIVVTLWCIGNNDKSAFLFDANTIFSKFSIHSQLNSQMQTQRADHSTRQVAENSTSGSTGSRKKAWVTESSLSFFWSPKEQFPMARFLQWSHTYCHKAMLPNSATLHEWQATTRMLKTSGHWPLPVS